jgi:2'-5' RNA ligase
MPVMNHPSGNSNARVFFALWPTEAERVPLAEWQKTLQHLCGGRTMQSNTLHSTLVFIGDVDLSRLEALQLAAQNASGMSFELCFDMARYWGHNHIVYAAPSHVPPHLVHLVGSLEQQLKSHRFEFDQREYKPHVTLLRNARWTDAPLPGMLAVCWQIKDFALVQSVQKSGKAGYRVLARFPFA